MGYIAHDAVIVTISPQPPDFPPPDIESFRASLPEDFRQVVIGPITSMVNVYYTYVFAPDGSKEGWKESDDGNEYRERFKDLFRGTYDDGSTPFYWVHIRFGGDFAAEVERPEIVEFHG